MFDKINSFCISLDYLDESFRFIEVRGIDNNAESATSISYVWSEYILNTNIRKPIQSVQKSIHSSLMDIKGSFNFEIIKLTAFEDPFLPHKTLVVLDLDSHLVQNQEKEKNITAKIVISDIESGKLSFFVGEIIESLSVMGVEVLYFLLDNKANLAYISITDHVKDYKSLYHENNFDTTKHKNINSVVISKYKLKYAINNVGISYNLSVPEVSFSIDE